MHLHLQLPLYVVHCMHTCCNITHSDGIMSGSGVGLCRQLFGEEVEVVMGESEPRYLVIYEMLHVGEYHP